MLRAQSLVKTADCTDRSLNRGRLNIEMVQNHRIKPDLVGDPLFLPDHSGLFSARLLRY